MNGKRFTQKEDDWEILDNGEHLAYAHSGYQAEKICEVLNEFHEENKWLFKCVENQSVLIRELDSKIMAYNMEHKITIKLTEKDLKTLDKALSYYTHQKVCSNCKHLRTDCGIYCSVMGDNTNYDCSKYED